MERNTTIRELILPFSFFIIYVVFASYNLGFFDVPISVYNISDNRVIYIQLESEQEIDDLYLLVKNGKLSFNIYLNDQDGWLKKQTGSISDYYKWYKFDINEVSKKIKLRFFDSNGELSELLLVSDGELLRNLKISDDLGEKDYHFLIDEQSSNTIPINYMSETIFDEIYYVRAAEEYLMGKKPYETTHPPLGKLLIAFSISLFGFSPFGWRIMNVIFAGLMLPIIYFFGKEITGDSIGGIFSSALLFFDFMHFTMSRIATIDTFLVFFILSSQLSFLKYIKNVIKNGWGVSLYPFFISILFLALGFSTKWTAFFTLLGYFFYIIILYRELKNHKNTFNFKQFIFALFGSMLIFGFIYFLSFTPLIMLGYSLLDVYNLQWNMLSYHSTLTATHPFSSPWWSWPIILRPVWLYFSSIKNGYVSTIALLGNPIIWWNGIVYIIILIKKSMNRKNLLYLFILNMFFFQWIPYSLITRSLFLYHFYPNVIFLSIINSIQLVLSWRSENGKWSVIVFFTIMIILFGFFYPVLSGSVVSNSWRDLLTWLPGWFF